MMILGSGTGWRYFEVPRDLLAPERERVLRRLGTSLSSAGVHCVDKHTGGQYSPATRRQAIPGTVYLFEPPARR